MNFGLCCLCRAPLDEEEYHLGLGRCKSCARKCDEEVGFGTRYENVEADAQKTSKEATNATAEVEGSMPSLRERGAKAL